MASVQLGFREIRNANVCQSALRRFLDVKTSEYMPFKNERSVNELAEADRKDGILSNSLPSFAAAASPETSAYKSVVISLHVVGKALLKYALREPRLPEFSPHRSEFIADW